MISIDTETTGVDVHHGAKPFFVTTCTSDGAIKFWEWDVDPLSRQPQIPEEDLGDIYQLIDNHERYVFQNPKFDVAMLGTVHPVLAKTWNWQRTYDTLLAGHLLASNLPHNLTDMAIQYLGVDIEPYERELEQACNEARRLCRTKDFVARYGEWAIAKAGRPDMPSAKEKCWKFDTWLPKAIATKLNYSKTHPWHTVLRDYANADSAATLSLWQEMERQIHHRGLWQIYQTRLKVLPIAFSMEQQGLTVSGQRLEELTQEYIQESNTAGEICVNIAGFHGYDLQLPKNGLNNSLRGFIFDTLKLEPIRSKKALTDNPSLDKAAMAYYMETLPDRSKSKTFITSLMNRRKRDTALNYMEGYRRFWVPLCEEHYADLAQSEREDTTQVSREDSENKHLLDLDRRQVQGEEIRPVHRLGRSKSPSGLVPSLQRTDSGGDASSSSVRQPGLCQPESSILGHSFRQHDRHDPKGEGRQSQGSAASSSETDRRRGSRNEKTIRPKDLSTGGPLSPLQSEPSPSACNSKKEILEAPSLGDWFVLHPHLNPTGTATLRWSSSCPNEQNISKQEGFNLRYCFGPAPGREWWSLDAKNIELRIPAYEAGETEMIELFERPDDAPYYGSNHLLVAHVLYPKEFEQCRGEDGELDGRIFKKKYSSTLYQWTKNGNFAVQYGAVDKEDGTGTADRSYHMPGAQARIKKRFSKMEALNQQCIAMAEKYGYVMTIPDKTVDPTKGYPLLCTRTQWGRILPTVPLNYHIQSTAMWWMMKAMLRCQEQLQQWQSEQFFGYMIMQVHDELVFDFPAPPISEPWKTNLGRITTIKQLMEQGGEDIGIPTPVSIEYHSDNWSEGRSIA